MKAFRSVVATVVAVSMLTAPILSSADVPQEKRVSYSEVNQRVLDNYKQLSDLKDSESDLLKGLDTYTNPYIYWAYMGVLPHNSGSSKDGIYYQYAQPILVNKMNYESKLAELQAGITKLEVTLGYTVQKTLMDIGLAQDQLELYKQKLSSVEKKYENTKLKYEQGTASKIQLDGALLELNLTKEAVNKLSWQVKVYKTKIAQLAALPSGVEYDFEVPVDTKINYSNAEFEKYFESAKQTNLAMGTEAAKQAALDNETKYMEIYRSYVLESDKKDFVRRVEAQKVSTQLAESTLRKQLKDLFNQYEDANQDVANARNKVELAELDYKIGLTKLETNTMIKSDLIDFELNVNSAKLSLRQVEKTRDEVAKRIQFLLSNGVYIEGGSQ